MVEFARVDVQAASLNEAEDAMAVDGAAGGSEAPSRVLRPAFCCIELLCSCSSPDTPGATNATAMLWERHRAAVCTPAAIAAMCKCLAHPDAHVRLAVAKSLRVLARSQDAFTQETLGDGQLAEALVAALHGEEATSIEVCLAISNFVTTPSSPARQQFFDKVRPDHYCPCACVVCRCQRARPVTAEISDVSGGAAMRRRGVSRSGAASAVQTKRARACRALCKRFSHWWRWVTTR